MKLYSTPNFLRLYKKLPSALQEEAYEKIRLFEIDPKYASLRSHALHGRLKGRYSFSVNYRYRIVYMKRKDAFILLAIGDHEVYQ